MIGPVPDGPPFDGISHVSLRPQSCSKRRSGRRGGPLRVGCDAGLKPVAVAGKAACDRGRYGDAQSYSARAVLMRPDDSRDIHLIGLSGTVISPNSNLPSPTGRLQTGAGLPVPARIKPDCPGRAYHTIRAKSSKTLCCL